MLATVASLMAQIIPHFPIPANQYIIPTSADLTSNAKLC